MKQSRDFASSRIVLDSGRVLTKCDQCREMHADRQRRGIDSEPPCAECFVELASENDEAARIYNLVQGQIITRHNGQHDEIVDLNYPAVKIIMDLYGVNNQRACLEKVRHAFFALADEDREGQAT